MLGLITSSPSVPGVVPGVTPPSALLAMGGLYEAQTVVHRPGDIASIRALFAEAQRSGGGLTLSAGRRSFGEHFLPPPGASSVDTRGLGGEVVLLAGDGAEVVARVPAGFSFEALHAALPGALPFHPPTGDRITLGGAVSACTHDSSGYFMDAVRALELLTPEGELVRCAPGASGLGSALFELLPGSFGAFGWITHVELALRPLVPGAQVEIQVLESGPAHQHECVDKLEQIYREGRYSLGRGVFIYGCRRNAVLMGHRLVEAPRHRLASLPLTDEATVRNIVLQGIANRMPGLVHRLLPLLLRKGRRFHAGLYGLSFFQRSYDRAFDWLSSARLSSRVLRAAGVDPRLSVCHQTFAVAPDRVHRFLDLYFEELGRRPVAVRRLEQQDLIRLPPCRWPLHGAYAGRDGAYLFTPSFSVRRERESYREVRRCLSAVSERAFRELGVKVLLLKQAHCEPALLREMHAGFIERVQAMRREVDPHQILGSRLLQTLGIH
jgi:FAD/FMN-containing dehydrogenase